MELKVSTGNWAPYISNQKRPLLSYCSHYFFSISLRGIIRPKQGIDLIVFKGDVLLLDGGSCPDPLLVSSSLY